MRFSAPSIVLIAMAIVASETSTAVPKSAKASELITSADERWSAGGGGGRPEFERHVVPLLGKLGCNGRACHGSFQGQNGFRLSLFGHDPGMDHSELTTDEGDGPRVDIRNPSESLALHKPTHADEHDGGLRFERDSWQYRMLHDWIASGARWNRRADSKLTRLEVEPKEVRFEAGDSGQPVSLRTTAYFSDGTREDVTALTQFSTNDVAIAKVTDSGHVSAATRGDTSIVAVFAGEVVTSQIIVPVEDTGEARPPFIANNRADELVLAKLVKLGIHASAECTDEVFLRRVYLDVIGTLPTADEARRFLNDDGADKRALLIDQLLDRPEYAMYWATKFSDWTGNDNRFTPQPRAKTSWMWHDWLRDKLERNVPYDEIVGGFITATTREGRSIEEVANGYREMRDRLKKGFDDGTYASRRTNDLFWQKSTNRRANNAALQVAYAFLGVRLQCAQCHKHPFDRWTQDDFRGFTQFFAVMGRGAPKDVPKELTKRGKQQEFRYAEVFVRPNNAVKKQLKNRPMKLLGGETIDYVAGSDPRVALWEWMRSPENPFLAKAIANRLWGHYLGVGIVSPVDDFNAGNPPSNPQLLNWLARDFIEHGFDLEHLHRTILESRTYQTSWIPNDSNRLDERNFSHALLRRMPAEVVLDAINQLTGGRDRYGRNNAPAGDVRAINLAPSRLRGGGPEYVLGIFGRPLRTQTCDCERGAEAGLAQAMYLLNDEDVNRKISDPKGRLGRLLDGSARDWELIEELYLSTLGRYPHDEEMEKSLAFIAGSESRRAGVEDVLWSLLNVREFVFNH